VHPTTPWRAFYAVCEAFQNRVSLSHWARRCGWFAAISVKGMPSGEREGGMGGAIPLTRVSRQ
jgi:hypothetical protein